MSLSVFSMRTLGLVLLAFAACAQTGAKKTETLLDEVRDFQEGLRWRNYDLAADHLPSKTRARFLDAHDEIDKDLRIDDYEVVRVSLSDARNAASVRVRYTWHEESVGRVHETVVDQRWQRQGKVWRIVGSEHKTGVVLPANTLPVESEGEALP